MDCASARELLWPTERPRVAEGEALDARRHMQSCRACRAYIEWDDALVAVQAGSPVPVPPLLRERVGRRIARARREVARQQRPSTGWRWRTQAWRSSAVAAGIAAIVLIAAAIGVGWWTSQQRGTLRDPVFIEDYLRRAVSEDRITTSDPERVARFLTRELGRPARPLTSRALVIVSAEVCLLDGMRGAMIQYERNGQLISHYLIPRSSERPRQPARPRPVRSNGVALVTWEADTFEHALLAELPADSLIALVAEEVATSNAERGASARAFRTGHLSDQILRVHGAVPVVRGSTQLD